MSSLPVIENDIPQVCISIKWCCGSVAHTFARDNKTRLRKMTGADLKKSVTTHLDQLCKIGNPPVTEDDMRKCVAIIEVAAKAFDEKMDTIVFVE